MVVFAESGWVYFTVTAKGYREAGVVKMDAGGPGSLFSWLMGSGSLSRDGLEFGNSTSESL